MTEQRTGKKPLLEDWVCAGVVALAFPVGKIIGIMDDTVAVDPGPRTRRAVTGRDSAADPGVRLD